MSDDGHLEAFQDSEEFFRVNAKEHFDLKLNRGEEIGIEASNTD